MNEHEALQVVLVKAFESETSGHGSLSDTDRRDATRAAFDQVGSRGAPDAFVAARAVAASCRLAERVPAVEWILQRPGWDATWLWLAVAGGALAGITADVFGSGRQLNLLAPPAWLVILWNLAVYTVLCTRLFGRTPRKASPALAMLARSAGELMAVPIRRLRRFASSSALHSRAIEVFVVAWTRASQPLTAGRVVTLLHVASAAVAVALIAGMYLRGLVLDYRVGWGSTFLDTQAVHDLLSFCLGPALLVSGIQLPDVTQMEALRDASRVGREQASAAPWIHLYAIMLLITVVLPRALLACWSGWQTNRLRVQFPLSLEDAYFRALLRIQRGDTTQVQVLPYEHEIDSLAAQNLRRIIALAADGCAQFQIAPTTPRFGEDDPRCLPASLAHMTHLVVVFDLSATPEAENHAAFLAVVEQAGKRPAIMLVNESSFISRFAEYPQRLAERRAAWTAFAASVRGKLLFVDLSSPQISGCASELRALFDASAGS